MISLVENPPFLSMIVPLNLHWNLGISQLFPRGSLISSQVIEPESQLVVKVGGFLHKVERWLGQLQKSGFLGDMTLIICYEWWYNSDMNIKFMFQTCYSDILVIWMVDIGDK